MNNYWIKLMVISPKSCSSSLEINPLANMLKIILLNIIENFRCHIFLVRTNFSYFQKINKHTTLVIDGEEFFIASNFKFLVFKNTSFII